MINLSWSWEISILYFIGTVVGWICAYGDKFANFFNTAKVFNR